MNALRWSVAAIAASVVLALAHCGPHGGTVYPCDTPLPGEMAADGGADPCHCAVPGSDSTSCDCEGAGHDLYLECMSKLDGGAESDASEGPLSSCIGACVPTPPIEWTAPLLVWIGDEAIHTGCPELAPTVVYKGHAGLAAGPAKCGACTCAAPTGTCSLAEIDASSSPCAATSTLSTPFDPPFPWDGSCSAENAVPTGMLCSGIPCVRSITLAPLVEAACEPIEPAAEPQPDPWDDAVVACADETSGTWGQCALHGETCAPAAPTGFLQCIAHEGDIDCPAFSEYTDHHVVYADAIDTRACSACTCDDPHGGSCAASVSIYTDTACSSLLAADTITSENSACIDLPAGSALGSKALTSLSHTPGTCEPHGGEPMGSVMPADPTTLCCLTSQHPPARSAAGRPAPRRSANF